MASYKVTISFQCAKSSRELESIVVEAGGGLEILPADYEIVPDTGFSLIFEITKVVNNFRALQWAKTIETLILRNLKDQGVTPCEEGIKIEDTSPLTYFNYAQKTKDI
jgi:hypothetical protein